MNSPSPLVPQGAIPPKNTSRSARVLLIAASVVFLHVAGLGVVLMQGCQKDAAKSTAGNTETNTPPMTFPAIDTNPPPNLYTTASNVPPAPMPGASTGAVANAAMQPGATSNLAAGLEPVPAEPVTPSGPEKDYKVQNGDLLTTIARKNNVTLSALMKSNPNLDPRKLRVGQTIKVPAPAPARAVAGTGSTPPTAAGLTAGADTGGAVGTYKVKAGDTLTKIARTYGITVNQLRAANNMKTTQVQVGKVLKIPARTAKTAAANPTANSTQH